jgi:hypothetical protein
VGHKYFAKLSMPNFANRHLGNAEIEGDNEVEKRRKLLEEIKDLDADDASSDDDGGGGGPGDDGERWVDEIQFYSTQKSHESRVL